MANKINKYLLAEMLDHDSEIPVDIELYQDEKEECYIVPTVLDDVDKYPELSAYFDNSHDEEDYYDDYEKHRDFD